MLLLGLAGLALGAGLHAQPLQPSASGEIKTIVDRGQLIVAMPAFDSPPFFFERNGTLMGLDVELARRIAAALGVEARFRRSGKTFNDAVQSLLDKQADLALCKLSLTLIRAKAVRFSDPYLTLHHALALNRERFAAMARGRTVEEVLRDYTGTLGVIAGSSYVGYAQRKFPKAAIVEYPGWPEVVAAVKNGTVTAAYRDEFEIKRLPAKDPKISLTVRTVTLKDTRDALAIAVRPEDTQLLYFVNLMLSDPLELLTTDLIFKNFADWL